MGLDPRFIVTSDLEEYFVDKDSGAPLAAGIVTFYRDVSRSVLKPVYQITGSPPNYTYSVLPNPCILSSVGTFQDALGNNIVPYYFPYEGTPSSSTGEIDLYYITVDSSGLVRQFTREGWPNFTAEDVAATGDAKNFIPNGQFLVHNDIVSGTEPPRVSDGTNYIQAIAPGGWFFVRSVAGSSTFENSFERITTAIAGINDFPRYAFNFVCSSFNSSDQVRDLRIAWPNVFTFSAGDPPGTQDYTLFFSGESNDASTYVFDVRLIYNFGTGGSPSAQQDISIGSVSIGPGFAYFTRHINAFPVPSGTLGTNDDDYVAIDLRGPSTSWNVKLTDFALLIGNVAPQFFPVRTNAETLSESVTGWMPTPNADGSDYYLPIVATPNGSTFDNSVVGQIYAAIYSNSYAAAFPVLPCDGTVYSGIGYSALGIPYARLQSVLIDDSPVANTPKYGTGSTFITAYATAGNTSVIRLTNNNAGTVTAAADVNTGFTIAGIHSSNNPGTYQAYNTVANTVLCVLNAASANSAAGAGTTTFTVTNVTPASANPPNFYSFTILVTSLAAGQYFTFSNASTDYYMWFKVNGAGSDPAIGGRTPIQLDLLSSYTLQDIANCIREAMNSLTQSTVLTAAASTLTPGDYFTFQANNLSPTNYYVWYQVDSVGTDPAPGGIGIMVNVAAADTAPQVATKTLIAINSYQFATPDFQGMFLRGLDPNGTWDLDVLTRWSTLSGLSGANIGTFEFEQFLTHTHVGTVATFEANNAGSTHVGGGTNNAEDEADLNIANTGGNEVRPVNAAVNWFIKY